MTAALRRLIEGDRYPHAPRLDPLRAALARLEAGANAPPAKKKTSSKQRGKIKRWRKCAAASQSRQAGAAIRRYFNKGQIAIVAHPNADEVGKRGNRSCRRACRGRSLYHDR